MHAQMSNYVKFQNGFLSKMVHIALFYLKTLYLSNRLMKKFKVAILT